MVALIGWVNHTQKVRKKMHVNFTDQEWKEYITKVKQLKPLNDKEFEEYYKQINLLRKNPNYDFYPKELDNPLKENYIPK